MKKVDILSVYYLYKRIFVLNVCLYPIIVETAKPIRPKFLRDYKRFQARFMAGQNW